MLECDTIVVELPKTTMDMVSQLAAKHHVSTEEAIIYAIELANALSNEKESGKSICTLEGISTMIFRLHPYV